MGTQKIICDTDVIIDFWQSENPRFLATRHILEQVIGLDNVIVAAITKMELMIGAINKIDRLKISKKLTRFDSELMTPQISLKAIELIDIYSLSHGLSISDSLIAATALVV